MKDLLLLEWKKTTRSLYFITMLILLILFVSFCYVYSHFNAYTVEDYIDGYEQINTNQQAYMDELIESGADDAQTSEEIEFNLDFIETNNMLIEAAKNEDWQTIIKYELGHAEDYVTTMPSQKEENIYTWPTHFTIEAYYEKLKWMLERNIRPVFQISDEPTTYDRAFEDEISEDIAMNFIYNKTDTSSVYFLYRLLRWSLGIGGVIFFLFLFGNILTREGLDRSQSGSLNLLDTQPVKRWSMMLGKLITVISLTFLILAVVILFGGLLGVIFDRFGDWDYPVLVYEPDFSLHLIKMSDYILLALLLFFLLMIFCYSWLFFYSVLVKRTFTAIMFTTLTIIVGITLSRSEVAFEHPLAMYNPFNYFQVNEIIIMETAWEANNYNITMSNGVVSLIVSSLLLLLITYFIFRKRAV